MELLWAELARQQHDKADREHFLALSAMYDPRTPDVQERLETALEACRELDRKAKQETPVTVQVLIERLDTMEERGEMTSVARDVRKILINSKL